MQVIFLLAPSGANSKQLVVNATSNAAAGAAVGAAGVAEKNKD